jgi:iron complex outermembrane recepter protein
MPAALRSPIASAMALAIAGLAQPTFAADSPAPPASDETRSPSAPQAEVLVVGTRASLQSAIERKKRAATVVDSIVAEDVAQFPDKNIGEALQRITGVQLSRDFGEGTQVSIRGVEPDLNRVEINGVTMLGSSATGQRGADFREYASELVKSIDVIKGFTADMTEGGIGGTVSIETRKPLELEKPLFAVSAAAEYLDTASKTKPRGNLTYANTFFEHRLGFIINYTYDNVDTRGDFLRDTEWVRLADFDSTTRSTEKTVADPLYDAFPTFASCASITVAANRTACQTQFFDYSPRIPRYGIWLRNDKRSSGLATVQYQFTDHFNAYVETELNRRQQRLIDNNYSIDLTAASRFNPAAVITDANHNVIDLMTSATGSGTTGAGAIFGSSRRDFAYTQKSQYYSGGFTWDLDRFVITGLGVHSKGTTDTQTNNVGISATIPNVHVELDPGTGVPRFRFPNGIDPQDATLYDGAGVQYRPEEIELSEDQAKLDFDWKMDTPFLRTIEFGAQYRNSRSLRYAGGGYLRPDGVTVPSANVTINAALGAADNLSNPLAPVWSRQRFADFIQAVGLQTPGTFFDNGDVSRDGLPNSWLTPGIQGAEDFFDLSGFNHGRVRTANGFAQIPAHDIEEKIDAFYLQGRFETALFSMPLTGNVGVRYTRTEDDARGSNTIRERRPNGNGGTTDVITGVQFIAFDNKYSDVLPTFNTSLQIRDDLVSRFGFAKVLARPRPTDLVPNTNCLFDVTPGGIGDTTLDTCTAGNPDLVPYRADQFNLDLSWYANQDTLLSAALFFNKVETFVLASTLVRNVDLFGDGRLFDVRQPINGNGAKIRGVELSAQTAFTFLPSPFDGLGGVVNYTYSDAKDVGLFNSLTSEELPFPGLSKHSYNIILYYDKGPIATRLAYNSRTDWLQAAAERSGNPAFRDGSAYLDAKITYRIDRYNLAFSLEGKNLTGETERTTSGDIRLSEWSYPGRRFFAGVTFKH